MPAALSPRSLFASAAFCAGVVFVLFVLYERPGLGLGHFFYLSIALAAMAGGPRFGAAGGVAATCLYVLAVLLNPHMPSHEILTASTCTRLATYVTIGVLIGWFASRNRTMVAKLQVLAERDVLTGLPNTRAFEAAITRRLQSDTPFALLLADMDSLRDFNRDEGFAAGNDALRRLAETLAGSLGPEDDVARVGSDEFAVLAAVQSSGDAGRVATHLERVLASGRAKVTVGWAVHPHDGENALALYRAASERLYARKVMRSYVRPGAGLREVTG
jgi:diguanylate cyclase (GGDEF)-like protein